MVDTNKKIIVSNVVRSIVYKDGNKIHPISEEKEKMNPLEKYTFARGETFEIEEDKLKKLEKAFPGEIQIGEGLTSVNRLAEKDKEIAILKAEIAELKKGKIDDKNNK